MKEYLISLKELQQAATEKMYDIIKEKYIVLVHATKFIWWKMTIVEYPTRVTKMEARFTKTGGLLEKFY